MTSTNTPPLSQHTFLALQLHMHGCTILCAYLCWQSYILRGKCRHCWTCVGWCKWTFVQVCDTHLQGATPFLHLAGLLQMHQPLHPLALANDFQVWGLEHICEDCLQMHTFFRGVRAHFISQPILHLMCLKLAIFFVSSSPFDLRYRAKLWHFWNFLLDGLIKIWTTWCFSFHTIIMFPIGTCMTPNLQKCKLKKTQGQSSQFQRWWHPQTHHPSVNTPFWHCSCTCMGVQSYVHTSVDIPTF